MKRVFVRAMAATVVGAAAAGGLSLAAWGASDSVQACSHYVAPPDSGANVWVSGSRRGCTNSVRLTIELKKTYWGVDGVVQTTHGNGVNFEVTALKSCSVPKHGEFYGRLTSSAGGGPWQGVKQNEC